MSTNVMPAVKVTPRALATAAAGGERTRLPFIDALRGICATLICFHHFSIYPPLADAAMPSIGPVVIWFEHYGRVAQVFFIISGFVLASGLSHRFWDRRIAFRYLLQRYFRLAVPYMAAAAAAMVACAIGRGWLDERVVGSVPTVDQLLAHVFFLQNILGYENLSAGLWFVCINFQLSLIFIAALLLRDAVCGRAPARVRNAMMQIPMALGWVLACASLFYFNLDDSWDSWAVYFFGQFFLGVLVQQALRDSRGQKWLFLYLVLMAAAIAVQFRGRLVVGIFTGLALFFGGKMDLLSRWPKSRVFAFLGRTSYSLFLIHFPVLVLVATLWAQQEWTSPHAAVAGLVVAYVMSLMAAALFYQIVEVRAMNLSRWFKPRPAGSERAITAVPMLSPKAVSTVPSTPC